MIHKIMGIGGGFKNQILTTPISEEAIELAKKLGAREVIKISKGGERKVVYLNYQTSENR